MAGKSRATKWRTALVAAGGKAVGVTLTPDAAVALDTIQERFKLSQREAISQALVYAAAHMEAEFPRSGSPPGDSGLPDRRQLALRLTDLEQRMLSLEGRLQAGLQTTSPDFELEPAVLREGRPGGTGLSGEDLEGLVDFSARRMWEFGERVARAKLYDLARQEGVPIHDTLHEYGTFLSLNMDRIRDRMRLLK